MFQKNDKALLAHKAWLTFSCWFLAIAGIISGFILLTIADDFIGLALPLMIVLPILARIVYTSGILKLNYYCDIKLIRNKLYELDNSNLETFFKDNVEEEPQEDFQENSEEDFQEDNNDIPNAL